MVGKLLLLLFGFINAAPQKTAVVLEPGHPIVVQVEDNPEQSLSIREGKITGLQSFPESSQVDAQNGYVYLVRNFNDDSFQFGYDREPEVQARSLTGFDDAPTFRHEFRLADGTVFGRYGIRYADAPPYVVNYLSNEGGYRLLYPGDAFVLPNAPGQPRGDKESQGRSGLEEQHKAPALPPPPEGSVRLSSTGTYGYFLPQ